jgi:hypothetical protein
MKGTYTNEHNCPHCGHKLNHALDAQGEAPEFDKDKRNSARLGFCFYCHEIIMYLNQEILAVPEEIMTFLKETRPEFYETLMEAQKALREE